MLRSSKEIKECLLDLKLRYDDYKERFKVKDPYIEVNCYLNHCERQIKLITKVLAGDVSEGLIKKKIRHWKEIEIEDGFLCTSDEMRLQLLNWLIGRDDRYEDLSKHYNRGVKIKGPQELPQRP